MQKHNGFYSWLFSQSTLNLSDFLTAQMIKDAASDLNGRKENDNMCGVKSLWESLSTVLTFVILTVNKRKQNPADTHTNREKVTHWFFLFFLSVTIYYSPIYFWIVPPPTCEISDSSWRWTWKLTGTGFGSKLPSDKLHCLHGLSARGVVA